MLSKPREIDAERRESGAIQGSCTTELRASTRGRSWLRRSGFGSGTGLRPVKVGRAFVSIGTGRETRANPGVANLPPHREEYPSRPS